MFWGCFSFLSGAVWWCRQAQVWAGHLGTGRVSPKWSPWLFSLDVMRNTKSQKSFLHRQHDCLCPLGTLCVACVCVLGRSLDLAVPGQCVLDLTELGGSGAASLTSRAADFRDCPCLDFLCSVMILEQKSVHFFNSFLLEKNGIW